MRSLKTSMGGDTGVAPVRAGETGKNLRESRARACRGNRGKTFRLSRPCVQGKPFQTEISQH